MACYPDGSYSVFSFDQSPRALVGKYTLNVTSPSRPLNWTLAMNAAEVYVQDGGFPVTVAGQGTVLLFGDTFLGCYTPPAEWCNFSDPVALTSPTALFWERDGSMYYFTESAQNTRKAAPFMPLANGTNQTGWGLWPLGATHYERFNLTLMVYCLVQRTVNFTVAEVGLATFPGLDVLHTQRLPTKLPFEMYSLVEEGNYTYFLYRRNHSRTDCYLGRFRTESFIAGQDVLSIMEFWAGTGGNNFSKAPGATPLLEKVLPQSSIVYNMFLSRYVLLHSGYGTREFRSFYIRTSASLWGPWSEPVLVYRRPGKIEGEYYILYMNVWQQHLFEDGGRIMVFTYCEHLPYEGEFHELLPNVVRIELNEDYGRRDTVDRGGVMVDLL